MQTRRAAKKTHRKQQRQDNRTEQEKFIDWFCNITEGKDGEKEAERQNKDIRTKLGKPQRQAKKPTGSERATSMNKIPAIRTMEKKHKAKSIYHAAKQKNCQTRHN